MNPQKGRAGSQEQMEVRSDTPDRSQGLARKHRRGLTRIAAACERCRKRKQKCDNKVPICGPCSSVGAQCVMSDRLVIHPSPDCDCDSLRRQVSELQSRIATLTAALSREKELNNINNTAFYPDGEEPQLDILQIPPEQEAPRCATDSLPLPTPYSGRILRPTFVSGASQRGMDADILGSAWHLWHNDTSIETPGDPTMSIDNVPMSEYGEELINVYFDNYWAHLPVLHKPTFLKEHYYPVSQGNTGRQFSEFQVYIVFAIAACEKPRITKGYKFSHREFFRKAIEGIGSVMASDDLNCIQCLLLLCLYGRNEPQSVNMWHTTGLALRTALGIDLHRQESVVNDSLFEAEMAKRLFWSAYVMDRSMAMAMGRPLGIEDLDITMPLPLQCTDEQLTSSDAQLNAVLGPSIKDTSTFIHVIKIRRLNADIYKAFHSLGRPRNIQDMEALRSEYYGQLNEWLITAPRYLVTTSMFQSSEWFQIAYHYAILSLHRPSYATPVPSFEALRLCADSSISLISSYATLYAKNKVSYSFIALNSIFMAAITLLYSLRASPFVRQELTKDVMETNINTCISLFRSISNGRAIAERCCDVVSRLGKATLALFNKPQVSDDHVDMEFLSWFGLKSQHSSHTTTLANVELDLNRLWQHDETLLTNPLATPSVDGAWRDFFAQGFDWEGSAVMDFFPMALH